MHSASVELGSAGGPEPGNETLEGEKGARRRGVPWPALRPISHISQPCYICLFSIKMFLRGGFMSCFGSRLRRRSFCTDLTVEVGWWGVGSPRTVHGGWIPC